MRRLIACVCCAMLASCAHTLYDVRIPLDDGAATAPSGSSAVAIEDLREPAERSTHLGREIWSCERWFGDETFEPSRIDYLETLIAVRIPLDTAVELRLHRFDVVEYCEHTGQPSVAAAARNAGAKGLPDFNDGAVMGDTVRLRLAGAINGVPFDVTGGFDYGNLPYTSPSPPSSHAMYRLLLRAELGRMADQIVRKIPKVP
jgi:hypothetical protein